MDDHNPTVTAPEPPKVPRGAFLKKAAVAAAATAASGLGATVARAAGRVEAPYVKRPPSGDVYLWDAEPLFTPQQIAAFNKVYPDVKVHQQATAYVPKTPSLSAHLVTGVGVPDAVFHFEDCYLGRFAPALYDVGKALAPYVQHVAPCKLAVETVDGKMLGIPMDLCPCFLMYSTEIVAKAGVDVSKIITYDDLIAAALRVQQKVPTCKTPLFFLDGPDFLTFMVEGLAWQQHSGMADAHGKLNLQATAYTNAFTYLEKAAKAGLVQMGTWGTPAMYNLWAKDQVCFMHFADWFSYWNLDGLKPIWGKLGLAKQPVFNQGDSTVSNMGGSAWVVPAKAKRPDLGALLGAFMLLDPRSMNVSKASIAFEGVLPASSLMWPYTNYKRPIINKAFNEHQLLIEASKRIPSTYRYPTWYADTFPYYGGGPVREVLAGRLSGADGQRAAYNSVLSNVVQRAH